MPSASQPIREHIDSRGLSLQVDATAGVIRGVKVLGLSSKNGREYMPEALARAARLYDGKAVNIDHIENGERRSYADRIGQLRGVQVRADGLYADLHFNPKHRLAEQLIWDAQNAPENVGLSHDAFGRTVRRGGKAIVEEIEAVYSVDLVANPATTKGLFESEEPNKETRTMSATLQEATLETLRRERTDLVESIKREITEGAEAKAREAELKHLREENTTLKANLAQHERRSTILEELRAAKIDAADKVACSEMFFESLLREPDGAKRKALIEDRLTLLTNARRDTSAQPFAPQGPQAQSRYTSQSVQEDRPIERAVMSWSE